MDETLKSLLEMYKEDNLSAEEVSKLIEALYARTTAEATAQSAKKQDSSGCGTVLPWDDSNKIRIVAYIGHRLIKQGEAIPEFTVDLEDYSPLSVECWGNLACDSIEGDAAAGKYIQCESIEGNAIAGTYIQCDCIEGNATAGGDLNAEDIGGATAAGGSLKCADIEGNASAGGEINAGDIGGNASAGGSINCGDIDGNVTAYGTITCGDISGEIHHKS
jgi:hypothetical protein